MKIFEREHSDLDIIKNIKSGKESIGELYNKYFDKTYNFVYFKVKDKEVAEDLVSEAWFKIMKKIDKFSPEKEHQVSVWIFTVVRNHMFDLFIVKLQVEFNYKYIMKLL